jgi:hypothetical protein
MVENNSIIQHYENGRIVAGKWALFCNAPRISHEKWQKMAVNSRRIEKKKAFQKRKAG